MRSRRALTPPFPRAADYMRCEMGIPEAEVSPLCLSTYLEYGTTMAGLRVRRPRAPLSPAPVRLRRAQPDPARPCSTPPAVRARRTARSAAALAACAASRGNAARPFRRRLAAVARAHAPRAARAPPQAMGYDIDDVKWHAAAHGRVRHEKHLAADPQLRAMLQSIPLPLYVFTNADEAHAETCLRLLGVRDLFKGVIHYETMQRVAMERGLPASRVLCKPAVDAFAAALALAGGAAAEHTLFLDDSARNCGGAAAAGLTAVQVGAREPCEGALAALPDVRHLREVVPELWGAALAPAPAAAGEQMAEHTVSEAAAIEVLA